MAQKKSFSVPLYPPASGEAVLSTRTTLTGVPLLAAVPLFSVLFRSCFFPFLSFQIDQCLFCCLHQIPHRFYRILPHRSLSSQHRTLRQALRAVGAPEIQVFAKLENRAGLARRRSDSPSCSITGMSNAPIRSSGPWRSIKSCGWMMVSQNSRSLLIVLREFLYL